MLLKGNVEILIEPIDETELVAEKPEKAADSKDARKKHNKKHSMKPAEEKKEAKQQEEGIDQEYPEP